MGEIKKLIPAACAIIAVTCSFLSSFWCKSIKFEPAESGFPEISFGIWRQQQTQYHQVSNSGGTQIEAVDTCVQYPDTIYIDSKWKAARAFSIMAPIIGLLMVCSLFCVKYGTNAARGNAACVAIVITMFQGLTFLLLKSDACESITISTSGFNSTLIDSVYPNSCELDSGFISNIVATVFWFVTGLSVMVFGAPDDDGDDLGPNGSKTDDMGPVSTKPDDMGPDATKPDDMEPDDTKDDSA